MGLPIHDGLLQVFDVDHGGFALLTMPAPGGVQRVLIDAGHNSTEGRRWQPGPYFAFMGVKYIDLLVVTNLDEDHASGFPSMEEHGVAFGCILTNPTVPPKTIVHLKTEDGMGPGIEALALTLAVRQQMGWIQTPPNIPGLHITWSWNPYGAFDDENNLSLITTLKIRGFNFMFPGDMECAGFNHLLATCPPFRETVRGVDVLMASHHGRSNGICPDMFDRYGCDPKLVVISDNQKQYATQETTNFYASRAKGYRGFRGEPIRYVLTTRSDREIDFCFRDGNCFAF